MKILIVDDESDIREILKFNLERAGFEVLEAESAEEAKPLLAQDVSLILLMLADCSDGDMVLFAGGS